MKYRDTSGVQEAVKLADVPPSKFKGMVRRTITGGAFAATGIAGAAVFAWPWYVAVGLVGLGVHIYSSQLVNASLRSLVPLIRELVAAIKGSKADA